MSRHQQAVIDYRQEENRILLEQLGGKPKRFTDAQRIRLARKAKPVGRRRLGKLATLVTPDTLLRWFRVLVAKKWTFARTNPVGRPSVNAELEKLVITLLQENPTWGSKRIVGALANLGFKVSDSTVDNIRQRNGLDPAPLRGKSTSWHQFLQAHWKPCSRLTFLRRRYCLGTAWSPITRCSSSSCGHASSTCAARRRPPTRNG